MTVMQLKRVSQDPILVPSKNIWENRGVYNPAVVKWQNRVYLVYRAQGEDGISRLGMASLNTLTEVAERKPEPIFAPDPDSEYEVRGTEDPRITLIGNQYYMIYVAASKYPPLTKVPVHPREAEWRVRVCLAKTSNFASWSRYGVIISHIDSKDAALFPEKIEGGLCLLHRVIPQVRISIAPDGRNYKERGPIFGPRVGMWDESRVGIGAPPIKCPFGWILFYHAVDQHQIYRLGIALLDLHDPSLVIGRALEPILEPELAWEKQGQVSNVVFSCGAIEDDNAYWVYYGGADTVIGVASISKSEVWDWAKNEVAKSQYHKFEQIGNIETEETEERKIKGI